jgi:hypothetical protein
MTSPVASLSGDARKVKDNGNDDSKDS